MLCVLWKESYTLLELPKTRHSRRVEIRSLRPQTWATPLSESSAQECIQTAFGVIFRDGGRAVLCLRGMTLSIEIVSDR